MDWQPIETAPKTGRFIWLADSQSLRIGYWRDERWADMAACENGDTRKDLLFEPTHWQFPPALPVESVLMRD